MNEKIREIIDHQFSGVVQLTPEAYEDSLKIISAKIQSLYQVDEEGIVDIDALWDEYEKNDPMQEEDWGTHCAKAQAQADQIKAQQERAEILITVENKIATLMTEASQQDDVDLYRRLDDVLRVVLAALKKEYGIGA
jgi:hypothetical protein